jgi:hypothetical protein
VAWYSFSCQTLSELNGRSSPEALVGVIEICHPLVTEDETHRTSPTSRILEYCGKPKQNTEEHISEDELEVIVRQYLRSSTGNYERIQRTNASAVFVHRKKRCSRFINFWKTFVGGWLSGSKSGSGCIPISRFINRQAGEILTTFFVLGVFFI